MAKRSFKCKKCGKTKAAEKAPGCCGKTMEPMDVCTSAPSAEHSRPMDDEEPCDDSRG